MNSSATFTVLGASGFIGRNLCAWLRSRGHRVQAVDRRSPMPTGNLGHVVYAIGLTADFRSRPLETFDAHVGVLQDLLASAEFDSLLYLSSTRVYGQAGRTDEDAPVPVTTADPDSVYNASKLAGEAMALHSGRSRVRVVRLSNVVGATFDTPNLLDSIVRSAAAGRIELNDHPDSTKDYVLLDDVLSILPRIALDGAHTVYNIAGGRVLSHASILEVIRSHFACELDLNPRAQCRRQSPINIQRARTELQYRPTPVESVLPVLLDRHQFSPCAA